MHAATSRLRGRDALLTGDFLIRSRPLYKSLRVLMLYPMPSGILIQTVDLQAKAVRASDHFDRQANRRLIDHRERTPQTRTSRAVGDRLGGVLRHQVDTRVDRAHRTNRWAVEMRSGESLFARSSRLNNALEEAIGARMAMVGGFGVEEGEWQGPGCWLRMSPWKTW